MLKKNIFKFVCMLMLLCMGASFLFIGGGSASADVTDISASDFNSYYNNLETNNFSYDFSDEYVTDLNGTKLKAYCLRDDYILFAQNQNPYGLCWNFAGNTTIATTIMMATNEYYDFSEAWVSTVFNYLSSNPDEISGFSETMSKIKSKFSDLEQYYVGGGSAFFVNDYLSRRMGVVLESDYNYDEFQMVCDETVAYAYDMYSQYANDNVMQNLQAGFFNNYTSSTYASVKDTIINSIKNHIYTHGSIFAGMDWYMSDTDNGTATTEYKNEQITYKKQTTPNGGHAISIIGWDDEIVIDGKTGAWIALNSWGNSFGNEGVFYVSYNDADFDNFWGYKYVDNSDMFQAKLQSSTAEFESNTLGAYYGDLTEENGQTKQKNVFYKDQMQDNDFTLTYEYYFASDVELKGVNIYYYGLDVTDKFLMSPQVDTISFSAENLDCGAYKIIFVCEKDGVSEEYINCFYVMDGTEINYAYYNVSLSRDLLGNNGSYMLYNDYNLANKNIVIGKEDGASGSVYVLFYLPTYSTAQITSTEENVSISNSNTDESIGKLGFVISFKNSDYGDETITFIISNGSYTRNLDVVVLSSITAETDYMVNVVYDTNGGINNENNQKRIFVQKNNASQIYKPTYPYAGVAFAGWYLDNNFTTSLSYVGGKDYYKLETKDYLNITNPTVDPSCQKTYNQNFSTCKVIYLYANWKKVTYNIYYYKDLGGSIYSNKTLEYGTLLSESKPSDPTKTGYKFVGWYTQDGQEVDFNQTATQALNIYAEWEEITYTVSINFNNDKIENKTKPIGYGQTIEKPTETIFGYVAEWYSNSALTELFDFNTPITKNTNLYAKWLLEDEQNSENITFNEEDLLTYTDMGFTFKFSHKLNNLTVSGELYRNGQKVEGANIVASSPANNIQTGLYDYQIVATDNLQEAGKYTYYIKVTLSDGSVELITQSEGIDVYVGDKETGMTAVRYNNKGKITWRDNEPEGASYILYVYKDDSEEPTFRTQKSECESSTNEKTDKISNIWTFLQEYGDGSYRVEIVKYVGEEKIGQATLQENIVIYKVCFEDCLENYTNQITDIIVDKDAKIELNELTYQYYNFRGWFKDEDYTSEWNEDDDTVTQNITLYAKWEINNSVIVSSENVDSVGGVYEFQKYYSITLQATHDIYKSLSVEQKKLCSFSFEWQKQNGEEWLATECTEETLSVTYVKDSGTYKCKVTFTDLNGLTKTNYSNEININITKAPTGIINNIGRIYTYNGQVQTIKTGATLDRDDDIVPIQYQNASFKDVPQGGKQTVTLYAPESDNYQEAELSFDITINKADGKFTNVDNYKSQEFYYCGGVPQFKYELNDGKNNEQKVVASYKKDGIDVPVVNAGEYFGVTLIAEENNNYKSASVVVDIVIKKSNITVKAKDIISIWLFNLKDLEYEITGAYFDDDLNLQIECNANKNQIGSYNINIFAESSNYNITIVSGQYRVTGIPYYACAIVLVLIIVITIIVRRRKNYAIDFEENGGQSVKPVDVKRKKDIKIPDAVREGYRFIGWFYDEKLTKPYNKKVKRGKFIWLYAKWEKLEGELGLTKQEKIDKILRDLNIVKPQEQTQTTQEEKTETIQESTNKNLELKSHQNFLNNIISKASTTEQSFSNDELDDFINKMTKK